MRLHHLTAGAGGMYRGICLRDNTVAAELMARDHDVSLLPVYTRTRTDERNVSDGHVFELPGVLRIVLVPEQADRRELRS